MRTPNVGPGVLNAVAVSARNAWAVGSDVHGALIEHWNGKGWAVQRSPRLRSSGLAAVAATSPRDAWAVGRIGTHALIEHWNGRAWNVQASPKLRNSSLSGVAAISASNAWAVGSHTVTRTERFLIEHWNGRRWTIEPGPKLNPKVATSQLSGMAVTSSHNAWAVGSTLDTSGIIGHTLVLHWDGRAWKTQRSPNPVLPSGISEGGGSDSPVGGSGLVHIVATSATNAWAVGSSSWQGVDLITTVDALIEHWDGRVWRIQTDPQGPPTNGAPNSWLSGVAASSRTNVWAVGAQPSSGGPIIERWNGTAWIAASPTPSSVNESFNGVATISHGRALVVGSDSTQPQGGPPSPSRTLAALCG